MSRDEQAALRRTEAAVSELAQALQAPNTPLPREDSLFGAPAGWPAVGGMSPDASPAREPVTMPVVSFACPHHEGPSFQLFVAGQCCGFRSRAQRKECGTSR